MQQAHQAKQTRQVSDEAVRARTGKDWAEWFSILDAAGAAQRDHKGIVALVREYPGVAPWWQQMITVRYEQERDLREKHQKPDGYQVGASRTIAAALSAVYDAWEDNEVRNQWLGEPGFAIRKATTGKSLRITWADGRGRVDVNFYSKGDAKSQVVLEHSKLADAEQAARMKAYWSDALDRLKTRLES